MIIPSERDLKSKLLTRQQRTFLRMSAVGNPVRKQEVAEMLAAGIQIDELDPRQPRPLTGYTAHYCNNDRGKPQKVVRLISQ